MINYQLFQKLNHWTITQLSQFLFFFFFFFSFFFFVVVAKYTLPIITLQGGIQLVWQGVWHSSKGCTTKMETINLIRLLTRATTIIWNQFVLNQVVTITSLPWTLPPQQNSTTHISSSSREEKGSSLQMKCFSQEVLGLLCNWLRDMLRMRAYSSTSLLSLWLRWET